ncbi:antibiotic biosynthesis monooxygenase [Pseudonocardia sp. CNS-139]|nr:antibiotic biosynthesis monooxygenase [Pseudonocardia sp. CNS-139]
MIFIVVKFTIRPELSDEWLTRVDDFTQATRAEPGNIFFEWNRSVEQPNTYVVVEAFQDGAAGDHVNSAHFKEFVEWAPDYVATTPDIISLSEVPGDGWTKMGEISPR